MERPCMNPASTIWPERTPDPATTVSAMRRRPERDDRPVVILNRKETIMINPLPADDAVNLEMLVDRFGLASVVDALGAMCFEKAEHIESTWGDAQTAHPWTDDGRKLQSLAVKLSN